MRIRGVLIGFSVFLSILAGCFEEESPGPLVIDIQEFTVHDLRNLTLEVSFQNTGEMAVKSMDVSLHVDAVLWNYSYAEESAQVDYRINDLEDRLRRSWFKESDEIQGHGWWNRTVDARFSDKDVLPPDGYYQVTVSVRYVVGDIKYDWLRTIGCWTLQGDRVEGEPKCILAIIHKPRSPTSEKNG